VARDSSPGAALDSLRETLGGDLERASSFVTLFHARLAVGPHEVRYVDAGHGHALVRRASGAVERLECGGRPVGFPAAAAYRECTLRLDRGDLLAVYSDGLIEGSDQPPEHLFDGVDVAGAASQIVDQLIERAPTRGSADDVTALVLKCASAQT
jgi:serine phosphatase RsbU (regulator of sigma subunit)